jgi:sugar-specific transcriptional regulator TrmB
MSGNASLQKSLTDVGFSDKEANVYLALLELGKGTVSEIARKANINRTTGYDILNTLVNEGLASISGKEPKREYVAESPDKIRGMLTARLQKEQESVKLAENLIPQLKSIHNVSGRPQVRFYEGEEGLIQVYEDTLTSSEPIRAYATVEEMHRVLPHYFPAYYKRRASKGIAARGILPKTPGAIERSKHNREEAREVALIPPDKYYFSPEICIYDNKVMIASWREKLGIIIESAEFADAMKKIFEIAWVEAKRLESENERLEN